MLNTKDFHITVHPAALSCLSECLAVNWGRWDHSELSGSGLSGYRGMFRAPGYEAGVTAGRPAEFIADFTVNGSRFFNGKYYVALIP